MLTFCELSFRALDKHLIPAFGFSIAAILTSSLSELLNTYNKILSSEQLCLTADSLVSINEEVIARINMFLLILDLH